MDFARILYEWELTGTWCYIYDAIDHSAVRKLTIGGAGFLCICGGVLVTMVICYIKHRAVKTL